MMKIFFDTEFYENGVTIELISIGLIREDGKTYYAETANSYRLASKSGWLIDNVRPHLINKQSIKYRGDIAGEIINFVGEKPEFWAYYADYDWVVLCQLYGTMMKLPKGWPMFCMDIKQLCVSLGNPQLPPQDIRGEHNALHDARWCKEAWEFLQRKMLTEFNS